MSRPAPDLNPNAVSFHEATVVAFQQNGSTVELRLKGIWSADRPRAATLILENIARCKIDGAICISPFMEAEDGEVLTLNIKDDGIQMLVEWNDWTNRKQFIRSYDIMANSGCVAFAA